MSQPMIVPPLAFALIVATLAACGGSGGPTGPRTASTRSVSQDSAATATATHREPEARGRTAEGENEAGDDHGREPEARGRDAEGEGGDLQHEAEPGDDRGGRGGDDGAGDDRGGSGSESRRGSGRGHDDHGRNG